MWDTIENVDIEKCKDRMTFSVMYQLVLENVLFMLEQKDSATHTLDLDEHKEQDRENCKENLG